MTIAKIMELMNFKQWAKIQASHELEFWKDPVANDTLENYPDYKTRLIDISLNMFRDPKLNFENKTVCDIGSGPYGGVLSSVHARTKLAIDPLNLSYLECEHSFEDIHPLAACCENLPIPSQTISACFCTNALDHMYNPNKALEEMVRILEPGGYFALAVDIGGSPGHPLAIESDGLDRILTKQQFEIIEKRCSHAIKTTWPSHLKLPLFVFQGYKKG